MTRTTGGKSFKSEALDIVFNTVVFHPKDNLQYGKTYYVTVDEGVISDSSGTKFSVDESDQWTFTVRDNKPSNANSYTLAADGSGDFCSMEGLLQHLPDKASNTRLIKVKKGVYPGIVRMKESNIHFKGEGIDESVIAFKNSSKMNGSRAGLETSGSDITFEDLSIFNTYLKHGGQQAEALLVQSSSERVFLDNVHLRSMQDTLQVKGKSVYMKGGKISGSIDPLWGTGKFYCDGCELMSRTNNKFVVHRDTSTGFAMVNCKLTKETNSVNKTYLAQFHANRSKGKVAFINCQFDDHVTGWVDNAPDTWWEYGNTRLESGQSVTFGGRQLSAGSSELDSTSSAQKWLGWSP